MAANNRPNSDPFAALASFPQPSGQNRSSTPLNALSNVKPSLGPAMVPVKAAPGQPPYGTSPSVFSSLNAAASPRAPSPSPFTASIPVASPSPGIAKPVTQQQKQDPFSGIAALGGMQAPVPKIAGGKPDAFGDLLGMPLGAAKTQTLAAMASGSPLAGSSMMGTARPMNTPSPAPVSPPSAATVGLWNFDLLSQPSTTPAASQGSPQRPLAGAFPLSSPATSTLPPVTNAAGPPSPDPFDIFNSPPQPKPALPVAASVVSTPVPAHSPSTDDHPLGAILSSPIVSQQPLQSAPSSPEAPVSPPIPPKPLALEEEIKASSPPNARRSPAGATAQPAGRSPSTRPSSAAPPPPPAQPPHDELVAKLVGMGFSADEANSALEASGGDMQSAVDMLISGATHATRDGGARRGAGGRDQGAGSGSAGPDSGAKQPSISATASVLGGKVFAGAKTFLDMSKRAVASAIETAKDIAAEQMEDSGVGGPGRGTQGRRTREGTSERGQGWEDPAGGRGGRSRFRDDDGDASTGAGYARMEDGGFKDSPPLPRSPQQQASSSPSAAQPSPKTSPSQPSAPAAPVPPQATPPPRQPTPPPPKPEVIATPDQLAASLAHKTRGTEFYKQGQYGDAETAYTAAIAALPSGHLGLAVLHNNRAACRLKNGDYRACIEDCDVVAGMDGKDVKCLLRRGTAWEGMERWDRAREDYRKVLGLDGAVVAAREGVRRCEKALRGAAGAGGDGEGSGGVGGKSAVTSPPRTVGGAEASAKAQAPVGDDLAGLFGGGGGGGLPSQQAGGGAKPAAAAVLDDFGFGVAPVSNTSAPAVAGEALQSHREREMRADAEDAEKFALKDRVEAKITNWRRSKENNIRALLASLELILWPELGVKNVQLSELVSPGQVKVRYMKVIARVHPDKVSATATTEQRMLANAVFGTLNAAFEAFKSTPGNAV
ncbi:hypothetical protein M427DRAFT_57956 [Gonapodya prolifera JEL478]|uniref:UBA domain-containing protein n=1 Tax=Gonapodya prolifera (strain JEL478) TaxID=1344416 RepID=A0A139AB95_GONPJ|nr:hypothetical protein M427DRAFT_57956 [Gonapodya prolifera JEL478]|eukprot:KXS13944.1 hypothetical protein M427DRAFT_57956 [Gonapodya prolifera JEL478]